MDVDWATNHDTFAWHPLKRYMNLDYDSGLFSTNADREFRLSIREPTLISRQHRPTSKSWKCLESRPV